MPFDTNTLTTRIQLDGVDQAGRELAKLEQRGIQTAQRIGRSMSQVGRALTVGVTAPILLAGGLMIKLGIDAAETRDLISVSFGAMTSDIEAWSQASTASIIQTRIEVQRQAASFFVMAQNMGLARRAAFDFSTAVVEMSADFASFNNERADESIEKVQAAFIGSFEPLRQYNIFLSEAVIGARALADGMIRQGEKVTGATRIMAIYNEIVAQGAVQMGNVELTADSAANRIKNLQARIQDAGETMGEEFLPIIAEFLEKYAIPLVEKISEAATAFSELDEEQQKAYFRMAGAAAAAGPASFALGEFIQTVSLLTLALRGVRWAAIGAWVALTAPVTIPLAILAAIGGGAYYYTRQAGPQETFETLPEPAGRLRQRTLGPAGLRAERIYGELQQQFDRMMAEYERAQTWIAARGAAGPEPFVPGGGGGGAAGPALADVMLAGYQATWDAALAEIGSRTIEAHENVMAAFLMAPAVPYERRVETARALAEHAELVARIQSRITRRAMGPPGLTGIEGLMFGIPPPVPPFPGFPTYGGRGAFDVTGAEGLMFPVGAGAAGGGRRGFEGWGGADWATLAGTAYAGYQMGGARGGLAASLPLVGSAFGPWGILAGTILGGLFGRGARAEPIIEPIPVKVINWADMESAFLKITQGLLRRGVGAGIDDLVERLRMKEVQVGLEGLE